MFKLNILEFQQELKNFDDSLIIVEGKKDKNVLYRLGFRNILEISGKPIYQVVNKIKNSKYSSVVILTDFDHEGRKKASILYRHFISNGIKINFLTRQKVKKLLNITKIEELNSFTKLLDNDSINEIVPIYNKILARRNRKNKIS